MEPLTRAQRTCGNCFYGDMIPNDLTQRICKGAPPQAILLSTGPNSAEIKTMWPNVQASARACALWETKFFVVGSAPIDPPSNPPSDKVA